MSTILDTLGKPFPDTALKQREGGGNRRFTYVETHTVIHRLNDACPDGWDWRIVKQEWHGELLICYGELTIPGLGTRAGIGVQKVSERGGEDLIKGASSDALKKAATLFGVALDLYGPDYEEGELPAAPLPQMSHTYPFETHYGGTQTNGQAAAPSDFASLLTWLNQTTEQTKP